MAQRETNSVLPCRVIRPWLLVTTAMLVLCPVICPSSYGTPQSLLVVSVDGVQQPANPSTPAEASAPQPLKQADQEKSAGATTSPKSELAKLKDEGTKRYAAQVREEEQQALGAVRPLTNDEARQWLESFISRQPLNCPHTPAGCLDSGDHPSRGAQRPSGLQGEPGARCFDYFH